MRPFLLPIWALRHELAAYDARYVVLSQVLGAELVTTDRRLARTAARYCDVAPLAAR